MHQNLIFYPVFAMIFLTLYVALRMLVFRFRAVKQDGLSPVFFKLNRGGKQPDYLVQVSQNYENLFEMPVLFYLGVVIVFVLGLTDTIYLVLAWSFVFFRVWHTIVHTTINKLRYRRNVFLASVIVLYAIWMRMLMQFLIG